MKTNYLFLLITLLFISSCSKQEEINTPKEPEYLSTGNQTFTINVNETFPLEGELISIEDDFISEIKGNSIIGKHIGETEISMKGSKGIVRNKIIVNGSYNIIKKPFFMESPNKPLPIPSSVLFEELGEVDYYFQSQGRWHYDSYIAPYKYGELYYYYISEPNNSSSIEYIEIQIPINTNNLLYCNTFLTENYEYLSSILGEEWYYHMTKGVIDYKVRFFIQSNDSGTDVYRIEYSIP